MKRCPVCADPIPKSYIVAPRVWERIPDALKDEVRKHYVQGSKDTPESRKLARRVVDAGIAAFEARS